MEHLDICCVRLNEVFVFNIYVVDKIIVSFFLYIAGTTEQILLLLVS